MFCQVLTTLAVASGQCNLSLVEDVFPLRVQQERGRLGGEEVLQIPAKDDLGRGGTASVWSIPVLEQGTDKLVSVEFAVRAGVLTNHPLCCFH